MTGWFTVLLFLYAYLTLTTSKHEREAVVEDFGD